MGMASIAGQGTAREEHRQAWLEPWSCHRSGLRRLILAVQTAAVVPHRGVAASQGAGAVPMTVVSRYRPATLSLKRITSQMQAARPSKGTPLQSRFNAFNFIATCQGCIWATATFHMNFRKPAWSRGSHRHSLSTRQSAARKFCRTRRAAVTENAALRPVRVRLVVPAAPIPDVNASTVIP